MSSRTANYRVRQSEAGWLIEVQYEPEGPWLQINHPRASEREAKAALEDLLVGVGRGTY